MNCAPPNCAGRVPFFVTALFSRSCCSERPVVNEPQCAAIHSVTSAAFSHLLGVRWSPLPSSSRLSIAVITTDDHGLGSSSHCSSPPPHTRHVKR